MDENNNNGFILVDEGDSDETVEESVDEVIIEEPIREQTPEKEIYFKEPKKKGFRGSVFSYIALALVFSLLGGIASTYLAPKLYGVVLPYPANNQYTTQAININTNDDLSTVSAVAKKAMSSVVGITTVETQQNFFSQQDVSGVGSGVIIDSNGYILTNSHVVADGNAKELKVLFENGEQVDGTVLWNEASLDLAIVKVDVTNLPVADLGDSDTLEVGEIAIAIGNPLGLEFQRSVTSGIISGLNRSVTVDGRVIIDNLIQTDASINPGNSGGPLLNAKGEVIGINTAKITSGEGLGFSIPINEVKSIAEQIIKNGTFKTVFMGITGVSVEEYESRLGVKLSTDNGIVIIEVQGDSPAAKAGVHSGDIITHIDNTEVTNMSQLKKALHNYNQNDKANLRIIRNSNEVNMEIDFSEVR